MTPKKTARKRVCLFMDVEHIKALRAMNEKTGVPMSEIVRRVLAEFFKGAK